MWGIKVLLVSETFALAAGGLFLSPFEAAGESFGVVMKFEDIEFSIGDLTEGDEADLIKQRANDVLDQKLSYVMGTLQMCMEESRGEPMIADWANVARITQVLTETVKAQGLTPGEAMYHLLYAGIHTYIVQSMPEKS